MGSGGRTRRCYRPVPHPTGPSISCAFDPRAGLARPRGGIPPRVPWIKYRRRTGSGYSPPVPVSLDAGLAHWGRVPDDYMRCPWLTSGPLLEGELRRSPAWLDVYHAGPPVSGGRVEIGIVIDHDPETGAGIPVWIPPGVGLEPMTVIAEEPGIVVMTLNVVGSEVQSIADVLPIRH